MFLVSIYGARYGCRRVRWPEWLPVQAGRRPSAGLIVVAGGTARELGVHLLGVMIAASATSAAAAASLRAVRALGGGRCPSPEPFPAIVACRGGQHGSGSSRLRWVAGDPHLDEDSYVRKRGHQSMTPVKDCPMPGSLDRSTGTCHGPSPQWKRWPYSGPGFPRDQI